MSGVTIQEFLVAVGFKVDEKQLQTFQNSVADTAKTVAKLSAVATGAVAGITAFVSSIANKYDALDELSKRTQIATDEIMRLGYVAQLTDSSQEALQSSLESLSKAAGLASIGMGRAAKVFEELGIKVKDGNGKLKDTPALMKEIGDAVKGMEKGKQLAILERLGLDPTLLQMLTTDVSGLKAEFDALFSAAGIDANKAGEAAGEFQDEMYKLKFTMTTLKDAIGLQLLGTIRKSVDGLRQMLMRNIPLIIETITPFIKGILEVSRAFLQIVGRIAGWAGAIISWLVKLNKSTGGWVTGIIAVGFAWKVLNSAFLASPLGRLVALGAVIALLVDDFLTWRERGDSLIDWGTNFGVLLQVLVGTIGTVLASMALYKGYIIASTIATKAWAGATAIMNGVLGAARVAMLLLNLVMYANPIGLVVGAIALLIGAGVLLVKNWGSVKKWFSDFFGWFSDKFAKIGNIAKTFAGVFGGNNSLSLTPSPSQAASLGGANQNITQKTEIIVNGSSNPQATASLVAGQQGRVNADLARNTKGATR